MFPDLELEAKAFAIDKSSEKNANFNILELANFITK